MTSKAEQLFLELCLLRLRYSEAEIERVGHIREVMNDPDLRILLTALRELQISLPIVKRHAGPSKKSKGLPLRSPPGHSDVRKTIAFFVNRIVERRILRTSEELEKFVRSIGIAESFKDRQEAGQAIRRNLESMSPGQARQKMRITDHEFRSDSDAYVDLAKTLMKSQGQ